MKGINVQANPSRARRKMYGTRGYLKPCFSNLHIEIFGLEPIPKLSPALVE